MITSGDGQNIATKSSRVKQLFSERLPRPPALNVAAVVAFWPRGKNRNRSDPDPGYRSTAIPPTLNAGGGGEGVI